jgi:hypothetical protein
VKKLENFGKKFGIKITIEPADDTDDGLEEENKEKGAKKNLMKLDCNESKEEKYWE